MCVCVCILSFRRLLRVIMFSAFDNNYHIPSRVRIITNNNSSSLRARLTRDAFTRAKGGECIRGKQERHTKYIVLAPCCLYTNSPPAFGLQSASESENVRLSQLNDAEILAK